MIRRLINWLARKWADGGKCPCGSSACHPGSDCEHRLERMAW